MSEDVWHRFRIAELTVKRFDHWLVAIRPGQLTLGTCVLLLEQPTPSLGDLSEAEAIGLPEAASWFERRCRELFRPDRFNYVAAMMTEPFVHFHAVPRYESLRSFAGEEWTDEQWPRPVQLGPRPTSDDVLGALVDAFSEDVA